MKKLLYTLIVISLTHSSFANPAFGDKKTQIMLNASSSTRHSKLESKLKYTYVNLSFADTFFGFNTRDSLEAGYIFGKSDFEQGIAGASKELILGNDKIYATLGLGVYIKGKKTERISSHFTFGERASIGSRFGDANIELFLRHFSNAGLTSKNSGQNFIGLSVGQNF